MNSLKIVDNQLVLEAVSETLLSNVNKSFLTNDLHFVFDPNNNAYVYKGEINSDTVETVVEFLKMCNLNYDLDSTCNSFIEQNESQRNEFARLQDEGSKIKAITKKKIEIPFMDSRRKLKPYQIMPVIHGARLGSVANFSVPGSGKTWMAYATYFLLKDKGEVEKLLVVGPLSSFRPWENEYYEMTSQKPRSIRISGKPEKRKMIFDYSDNYEIFLTSYQTCQIENSRLQDLLRRYKFMMIVDESHHIKNPFGEWSNAILQLSPYAKKRMILSGTPVPNKIEDLWAQFTFLYPRQELLGDYHTFQYEMTRQDALHDISSRLHPFYTRISKRTLNLPEPKFFRLKIQMSQVQRRIYDAIKGFVRQNDPIYRNDAAAMQQFRTNSIIYLLEASTDPSLLTRTSQYHEKTIESEGLPIQELIDRYEQFEVPRKLHAVREIAEQSLTKGEKIIVWCSFIPTILKLSEMLKQYHPIAIWGAIPKDDEEDPEFNRESQIEKFKNQPDTNLLIANPASLAESVSLHKVCHHAIYLDRTFNGGHYMQSLERIHRIGIDPKVKTRYTILLSTGSIDQVIDDRLEEKKSRMLRFLNEEDFTKLNLDLDYGNAFGEEDEFIEDYKRVYEHIMKG